MSNFELYFKLGFQHITDVNGFDHILFLVALIALYSFAQLKDVIILASAFTAGHSISLILSTLGYVNIQSAWIEFLIPVTILLTGLTNLIKGKPNKMYLTYLITTIFGLIHGLGFSIFLQAITTTKVGFVKALLAFNIGLEVGQLVIIAILLCFNYLLCRNQPKLFKYWNYSLSIISILVASVLLFQRFPF